MDVTRQAVLIFTLIFGPLVLLSYVYGVSHSEDPSELWGGIPETWWSFIVPFMFIAAAGFMAYWYVIFFKLDEIVSVFFLFLSIAINFKQIRKQHKSYKNPSKNNEND